MNGLAMRKALAAINECGPGTESPPVAQDDFGLQRKAPIDPHNVEGRKWVRRMIIVTCVGAFCVVFMPDALRARLNKWAGTPVAHAQPVVDSIHCTNDWVERCLVCEHRLATGEIVKAAHC